MVIILLPISEGRPQLNLLAIRKKAGQSLTFKYPQILYLFRWLGILHRNIIWPKSGRPAMGVLQSTNTLDEVRMGDSEELWNAGKAIEISGELISKI